jgi:hypothetical protein
VNPLTGVLAAMVAAGLAGAGGIWYGIELGREREAAERDRIATVERSVRDEAMAGAAAAIAANRPRNVTIRQETEREIKTNVVYRDCVHSADQLQRINAALTGAGVAAGRGELPASDAAR